MNKQPVSWQERIAAAKEIGRAFDGQPLAKLMANVKWAQEALARDLANGHF